MGTSYSPKKVYETGLKQALAVLKANGAKFDGDKIIVPQKPITEMPFEEDAPSADKVSRRIVSVKFADSTTFEFEGVGVTLTTSPEFNKAFQGISPKPKRKRELPEKSRSASTEMKIRTAKFFADQAFERKRFSVLRPRPSEWETQARVQARERQKGLSGIFRIPENLLREK